MKTKKKLKLKKEVWIFLIIIIFLSIGIYAYINISRDIKYKKSTEYKLIKTGYTKEEITKLSKYLESNEIEKLINQAKNVFLLNLFSEPYYISENLPRYQEYYSKNPNLSSKDIVSLVNTNNDYSYYDHDIDADPSQGYLLLVNKYYNLKNDYKPANLKEIDNKYYYGSAHQVVETVLNAFIDMWNNAYQENIYLIINSSYRTFEYQKNVYDDYKNRQGTTYADSIAARPGYSEHQTGLALDIFSKEHTTTNNFKGSPAHLWLQSNAHHFGFIERYPENKANITGFKAEAWHWRYVGVEVATYIHEHNITFDEYYAYFIENNNKESS